MPTQGTDATASALHFGSAIQPLWKYVWAAPRRPFCHPVATPSGHVLTRDAPDDHPWHHALWFTIKFVNGENFWEEYDSFGILVHTSQPEPVDCEGAEMGVEGDLRWIRPDRETVIIDERRSLTHIPLDADSYAIDFHTELTPRAHVELDRTPFTTWGGYGGLAFRGSGDLRETVIRVGAEGHALDRALGERGNWLDLSGLVGGEDLDAAAGITILDAPANPNHPVPWYASTKAATYGSEGWANFVNAAFLWDGPLCVAAGETLTFNYRVIVHDGIWDTDRCNAAFNNWVGPGDGGTVSR